MRTRYFSQGPSIEFVPTEEGASELDNSLQTVWFVTPHVRRGEEVT